MKTVVKPLIIAVICLGIVVPYESCLADMRKNTLKTKEIKDIPSRSVEQLERLLTSKAEVVSKKNAVSKEIQNEKESREESSKKELLSKSPKGINLVVAPNTNKEKLALKELFFGKQPKDEVPNISKDLLFKDTISADDGSVSSLTGDLIKPLTYEGRKKADDPGFSVGAYIKSVVEMKEIPLEKNKDTIAKDLPVEMKPSLQKKSLMDSELIIPLKGARRSRSRRILKDEYNYDNEALSGNGRGPIMYRHYEDHPYMRLNGATISYTIERRETSVN
ncbi:MAG: hypothetical protein ABID09_07760 [Candidatus Omnitrophota bacterium]